MEMLPIWVLSRLNVSDSMIYCQDDTEDVLNKVFGTSYVGRFLDIGAYDGLTYSGTRMLFERGWGGVVVEVSIKPLHSLFELYKNEDRVSIVSAYVSDDPNRGLVKLSDGDGSMGSFCKEDVSEEVVRAATNGYTIDYLTAYAAPLHPSRILEAFPGNFDFVCIDTEGTNEAVARAIDYDTIGTKLVCVEKNSNEPEMVAFFKSVGFHLEHKNDLNFFFEAG